MPKQIKTCRVCGKEYEACHSIRTGANVFNWREVACSPECGMKYLEKVQTSRGLIKQTKAVKKSKPVVVLDVMPIEIEVKPEEVAEGEAPEE